MLWPVTPFTTVAALSAAVSTGGRVMPRTQKPIEAEWRAYAEQVIPFDASDRQLVECRKAFYAGATSLVRALGKQKPEGNPIEAYLAVVEGATDELKRFIDENRTGRA